MIDLIKRKPYCVYFAITVALIWLTAWLSTFSQEYSVASGLTCGLSAIFGLFVYGKCNRW
jgi:hypothetical protein